MRYVNNRCFISKILLVCCVHSLDFRYRELVRKYHTDRLCMKYSILISFVLIDIDECLNRSHACDVNANCTNTDGSYNCTCKEGYTGDGQSCQGILDQTVHHTGLLLTISRACPKFTNMERYNAIYKFRHGRWSVINYRTTFTRRFVILMVKSIPANAIHPVADCMYWPLYCVFCRSVLIWDTRSGCVHRLQTVLI